MLFLLDTNILMEFPNSWDSLFDPAQVIITHTTLRELDGLKPFKKQARDAIKHLESLVGVFIFDQDVRPDDMTADEHIIDCAHHHKATLVTNDVSMSLLANAEGITTTKLVSAPIDTETPVINSLAIDQIYKSGSVRESVSLEENTYGCMKSGQQSALFRCVDGNLLMLVDKSAQTIYKHTRARNKEQAFLIDALTDPGISLVVATGLSGTGKTLLSMAAGLWQTMEDPIYKRLIVSRPVVPMGNDIGFLPGSAEEKMAPWLGPIHDSLEVIMRNKKSMDHVMDRFVDIQPMPYIRGRSFPDSFVVIDEAQNLTNKEIKTIVTRMGTGTKLVLTGDPDQIDSRGLSKSDNGLVHVIKKMGGLDFFAHVHLKKSERSKLAEAGARLL